mmetsp:Transcript_27204/g.78421  ORF Transcript_27204/g.78421 Transcript_27204/m.78421 type:complete len:237 (-) Transcript_27204:598-1308(-)
MRHQSDQRQRQVQHPRQHTAPHCTCQKAASSQATLLAEPLQRAQRAWPCSNGVRVQAPTTPKCAGRTSRSQTTPPLLCWMGVGRKWTDLGDPVDCQNPLPRSRGAIRCQCKDARRRKHHRPRSRSSAPGRPRRGCSLRGRGPRALRSRPLLAGPRRSLARGGPAGQGPPRRAATASPAAPQTPGRSPPPCGTRRCRGSASVRQRLWASSPRGTGGKTHAPLRPPLSERPSRATSAW